MLLEDDPYYFNDLEYDEVVKRMTHILLVADELFPAHKRRCDEATGAGSDYSEVRGVHRLSWAPDAEKTFVDEFNATVDNIREVRRGSVGNIDKSSKDKTLTLQFIPPIDVIEKVVVFLLRKAGVPEAHVAHRVGEDTVKKYCRTKCRRSREVFRSQ